MPAWQISEPFISLWLYDEPLGYQPAVGPRISFKLAFKQRETTNGFNPNIFSVGKKWNFSWLSYVTQDQNGSNVVHFPYGGDEAFSGTTNYLTNTRLTGNTSSGFTLSYPDGSQDIYGFVVSNSTGAFEEAFLTAHWNPQSQETMFNYAGYTPGSSPVIRLQSVVDGDGHTNRIVYVSSKAFSTNLISQVIDPFGRTNLLAYNANGDLTNSIDVAGNSSSLGYDSNDWVTNLTTPYGTTSFAITDGTNSTIPNGRSILVTQPDGGRQLYLYKDYATGATGSYSTIPDTTPFSNTFDNSHLDNCDSYYWGPRQYEALLTTNISSFTVADFLKARMKHWLLQSADNAVGETLALERDPSMDSAGAIEGQKTWYDYTGKTNSEYEGTQVMPVFVARILPDGSTSYKRTERNSFGAVTKEISTYSANGSVLLRTNIYAYDPNAIDLIATTNALGVQISSNLYNGNHEVIASFDALNELTAYTYDSSNRLTSAALPNGLVTTNIYGPDGFVVQQIAIGYATNSYTYTNALVYTHTDPRGLTTTNLWDGLNRQVSTIFPDGSTISNIFTTLDLTATKDRMGYWSYFGFDSMRRKVAETNALNTVTLYNFCTCGSLESTVDALNNTNSFSYDNQGNQTEVVYADGYSVISIVNLLKQVVSTRDSGGYSVTNAYNNQGLVYAVSNVLGQIQGMAYDVLDRATNSVDANGVSIATTFDVLNRPLARSYPDNGAEKWGYTLNVSGATSYTNQLGNVTLYGFDAMNRKTNEVAVGVTTNGFAFNGAGDLLALTDGRNKTTHWNVNQFGLPTNKVDAAGVVDFVYQYDADNRLTNRWTPAKGNTGYGLDAVGNVTSVVYPQSTVALAYDLLNHLTNMVDGIGTTTFAWDSVNELLSEAGPWSGDTVNYAYANRLRTGLTLGTWTNSYLFDAARRMTNVASPAGGFGYGYVPQRATLIAQLRLPNTAYVTNTFDAVARLTGTYLKNGSSNNVLDGYTYACNQLGQRTNIIRDYGLMSSSAAAGYDSIGELTSWMAKDFGGVTRLNEQLGYAYDPAGNLKQRTNNALVQAFTVDAVNELTNITRSGTLTVSGNTPAPASSVKVNGQPVITYNDFTFASSNGFTLANGNNSFTNIAKNYYGTLSITNTITANLPTSVAPLFDANGNLTNDGTRSFSYDCENQLTNVTIAGQSREDFIYDGMKRRRITKQYIWQSGAWVQTNEIHFICDGNIVVQERNSNNVAQVTYTRGLDLSASLQKAGGIGGLLARTDTSGTVLYHADGNGNIMALMDTNQYIVGRYLYDPFGRTIGKWGTTADVNVYRFSSKEWDAWFGIYYYLYRFYDPNLQRWLNKDPIGDQGFRSLEHKNLIANKGDLNLYVFTSNRSLNDFDLFGLSCGKCGPNATAFINGVLDNVDETYAHWTAWQKIRAAYTLYFPATAGNAWDIHTLFRRGYPDAGESRCSHTFTYYGKCYWGGSLNFLLWGRINQLSGYSENEAIGAVIGWKTIYHWNRPLSDITLQAVEMTKEGYEYWGAEGITALDCDPSNEQVPLNNSDWTWKPYKQ